MQRCPKSMISRFNICPIVKKETCHVVLPKPAGNVKGSPIVLSSCIDLGPIECKNCCGCMLRGYVQSCVMFCPCFDLGSPINRTGRGKSWRLAL